MPETVNISWGGLTVSERWVQYEDDKAPTGPKLQNERAVCFERRRPGLRYTLGLGIPKQFDPLADAIEKSRRILELGDNWDGEGSPAYAEDTWNRACRLLLDQALALWNSDRTAIEIPSILNGPEGSIDIYWAGEGTLLLNIPADTETEATLYGTRPGGGELRISFRLAESNLLQIALRHLVSSNA